jgi:hypothetical protein
MSANLGTILVGLGYDLSALEKGAPEAFRLVNSQTLGMSAEMKRASREGAESLRLIDEALGIHLSRPLTRLLTQEFPALATALQSVLGVGAFSAISVVAFESFEKISKSIEKAMHAQDEWKDSITKTEDVIQSVADSYARKIAEANGLSPAMKAAMEGADEAKRAFDQVAAAIENENKKAEEAAGTWTQIKAFIGDAAHNIFTSNAGLNTEELQKQFATLKVAIDQAFALDARNGTHEAMKIFEADLDMATQKLRELQQQKEREESTQIVGFGPHGQTIKQQGQSVVTPEQLAAVQEWINLLKEAKAIEGDREGLEAAQARERAIKEQATAQEKLNALYKEMGSSLGKFQVETDPIKKLANEIRLMKQQADTDFRALGETTESALGMRAAMTALDAYDKRLDQVLAKAKREADVAEATAKLPTRQAGPPNLSQLLNTTAPGMGPSATPIAPQLGSGGTAGAQLSVFNDDQGAQLKLAAQAFQEAMSPADHYKVAVGELNTLLQKGLIDQAAYTAAVQHAGDALEQAEKKIVHAKDGLRSFFAEMQQETNTGKFTFDILSQGMKGFEDQVVKLITTGKANWREYFLSLEQSALKFFLNKEIMQGLKDLSGTSMGQSLGLGKLLGGGTAQAAASTQQAAATLMQTAANQQMAAAQLMLKSGGSGSGGFFGIGGGGGGGGVNDVADTGGYGEDAAGSDYTPGGMTLVGEEGPELLNLPTGSSVTPNSQLRMGQVNNVFHIDAKGSEIGVEEKISRALQASAPQMIMRAVAASSEVQKRSLQRG